METGPVFFALAIPAILFAGISKGGFGSNAAFAAAPFLALVLEPAQALGIMMPLLLLMDVSALPPYWQKWDIPASRLLIAGGIPGVLAGAALYRVADPDLFRLAIGGVSLGFVVFQVSRGRGWLNARRLPSGRAAGFLLGAGSGLTSFVSHAGGPVASIYLLSKDITKTAYQATTVWVFFVLNVLKFGLYAALGIFTLETLKIDLMLAPVAIAGIWAGVALHRIVPERAFFGLTYVLLSITGAKLIFDALT